MKLRNQFKKYAAPALATALALGTSLANAAIDIDAAATEAKTDITTAGGIIIGVMVAVAAVAWVRRVVH